MEDRIRRGITSLTQQDAGAFYVYDKATITGQAELLTSRFSPFQFLYSVKTNPFPPVVKTIISEGFGADAASAAEVHLAAKMGAKAGDIYYSAPGKSRADLESALGHCTIIADSYGELALLDKIAGERGVTAQVGLRINPDFSMFGEKGLSTKFGVDEETLPAHLDTINGYANLSLTGIHVHVRSQVLDGDALARYYRKVFQLALKCREEFGWSLGFLNFGGGLGVPYAPADQPLDIHLLGETCQALRQEFGALEDVRLLIETGRFMVCQSGWYVTPVVDRKESRGITYVMTLNGLNGFVRAGAAVMVEDATGDNLEGFSAEPFYTGPNSFELSLLEQREGPMETVTIGGNLCTAIDILAPNLSFPQTRVGDHIVISKAGSYAYSLSSLLFSSHPLPKQYLLEPDGTARTE